MATTPQTSGVGGRFPWEGVIERLTTLWVDEGRSASEIANELSASVGIEVTRNAVMGKVNRLGLIGEGNLDSASVRTEAAQKESTLTEPLSCCAGAPAPTLEEINKKAEITVSADLAERLPFRSPQPPGVGLFEARESQCRWPISEPNAPDFRFCGEPRESPHWSWCAAHMRLGFDQRSSSRRRADWEQSQKVRVGKAKAA